MTDEERNGMEAAEIAHLQMIQAVITRMASNSFLIKGWSVTLVAALFALAAANTNGVFVFFSSQSPALAARDFRAPPSPGAFRL